MPVHVSTPVRASGRPFIKFLCGLACLLHKFGDMTLVCESECQDVVAICGIELGRFGKFGLGPAEIFVIEKPRSGEISGFGLSFVEKIGVWLASFAGRRGGLLG